MQSNPTTEAVKSALESGILEVIVREGAAAVIHEPKPVRFDGVISSPSDYIRYRPAEITKENCIAKVNKEQGYIVLVVNDRDEFSNVIEGRIKVSEKFTELGINTGKRYEPEALAKLLRLKRAWFPSIQAHSDLIGTLRDVRAKIDKEVEERSDNNGNRSKVFNQVVQSNLPKSFEINIPLVQGGDPYPVEVEAVIHAENDNLYCELISVNAAETIEQLFIEMVEQEVQFLKEHVTVLFK